MKSVGGIDAVKGEAVTGSQILGHLEVQEAVIRTVPIQDGIGISQGDIERGEQR
jgi:hypothetical protein